MEQQLIDSLVEINDSNLFCLDTDVFVSLKQKFSSGAYAKFHTVFYSRWLADMYRREVVTSIVYQHLANQETVPSEIAEYLKLAAAEESQHVDILKQKIQAITGKLPSYDYCTESYRQQVIQTYKNQDLIDILITYFVGETGLLASFKLLKKHTTDPDWKKIFTSFMIDEAAHHNNILKLITKISKLHKNRNLLDPLYLNEISHFLYFQSDTFKFIIFDRGVQLQQSKIDLFHHAYSSEFVVTYQKDFLNKIDKLGQVLDSNYDKNYCKKRFDMYMADMLK